MIEMRQVPRGILSEYADGFGAKFLCMPISLKIVILSQQIYHAERRIPELW